jgi:DNA-directed RNA polymerase specialized sigma24 family protein
MAAADAEALFVEHYEVLLRYFARAIGQRDAARDLAQEVYLRTSRSAIPVASAPEVRAWLFRIARILVIDHHRARGRMPREVKSTVLLKADEVVGVDLPRLAEDASGAFANHVFSIRMRSRQTR